VLTLAPFDRRLIEPALLEAAELAWLDAYHARVASELSGKLGTEFDVWLASACRPLEPANSIE
jgi:Xaa-Pro aminopeptidase